ncbi:MAG: hypothetical protein IK109_11420 [Clostridiales bacterium]|nr:hypothetical protein [Clostridiales bacterium]
MKKRLISLASVLLTFSLLLTSCSKSDSKKSDKKGDADDEIVEVFEGYGKQLKKLSVSKITDYAPDSAMQDLDLSGDEEEIVKALLKKASFEVEETEIKEKKKSSTCTAKVKVNYVDLEKVLGNFDGEADKDSIIEAIGEAKASKKSVKVSLESDDGEWKIVDDSAMYELLFNGIEDLEYYLSPMDDPTTTTEEPTTTTTEEPTTTTTTEAPTTTTTEPDSSTTPVTGGVHQVLVGDELDKVLKDFGFTVEENHYADEIERIYEYDEDFIFCYYECQDSSIIKQDYDDYVKQMRDKKVDCEDFIEDTYKGTLNLFLSNVKTEDNHSYDFYLYYDETVLLIAGVDIYPNADPSQSYFDLIEQVGLWEY